MPAVFRRLDARRVGGMLGPRVPAMARDAVAAALPAGAVSSALALDVADAAVAGLPEATTAHLQSLNHAFASRVTRDLQRNVNDVLDLDGLVTDAMARTQLLRMKTTWVVVLKRRGGGRGDARVRATHMRALELTRTRAVFFSPLAFSFVRFLLRFVLFVLRCVSF